MVGRTVATTRPSIAPIRMAKKTATRTRIEATLGSSMNGSALGFGAAVSVSPPPEAISFSTFEPWAEPLESG